MVDAATLAKGAALILEPGDVQVWLAEPELALRPESRRQMEAVLSPDERDQQRAFVSERHRAQYLVAHALVRFTLSRYIAREPASWTFARSRYGRPEIACASPVPLRFSLSHTDGLVGVAVAHVSDVGFDLEGTGRLVDPLGIAGRYFAPAEIAALQALPTEQQRQRFFEFWTLKEAYAKARGFGLSLPLDQFFFEVGADGQPRVGFTADLQDAPDAWRFSLSRPTHAHCMALAVRTTEAVPTPPPPPPASAPSTTTPKSPTQPLDGHAAGGLAE